MSSRNRRRNTAREKRPLPARFKSKREKSRVMSVMRLRKAAGSLPKPGATSSGSHIKKMSRSTSGSASTMDAIARKAGAKKVRSGVKQVAVRMAPRSCARRPWRAGDSCPELLDLIRFGLGAVIARAERRGDLFRVDEADVGRRIGGDPKHLSARRFDLLDVVRDGMGHAGKKRRRQSVGDRDDESTLRTCDHIHLRGVRTDAPIHGVALAEQSGTDRSGQRRTRRGSMRKRNPVLARALLADDQPFARVAVD